VHAAAEIMQDPQKGKRSKKKRESEKSINFVSRDEKKELNWDDDGVCIK